MSCRLSMTLLLTGVVCYAVGGCSDDPTPGAPYSVIETYAGTETLGLGPEGLPPQETALYLPQDIAFAPDGSSYILDWNNHRILAVKQGLVHSVCGTGTSGDALPGQPSQVSLNHPTGVTVDPNGNLIIFAWQNSKVLRLDFTADWVAPICGTGAFAYGGDGGPATNALLDLPVAGFFDDDGRLVFMDQANQCIRRVENDTISTFAGIPLQAGFVDSVPAAQAKFNLPTDSGELPGGRIVIDESARIFVADTGNQRIRILEPESPIPGALSPQHEEYFARTFAGNGTPGYGGDGGPALNARLNLPRDVALDKKGNVYIADTNNHCIRKVDLNGVITTFAGTPGTPNNTSDPTDIGDGGSPTHAYLYYPVGICFDANDNLYIADMVHHRIRVIWKDPDAH